MDERLTRVEERLSGIVEDVSDMKSAVKDIAASLKLLTILEERHRTMDDSIKRAFTVIETNIKRLDLIEITLPNLSLASSWVFRAMIMIVGLLGTSFIVMLIKFFFVSVSIIFIKRYTNALNELSSFILLHGAQQGTQFSIKYPLSLSNLSIPRLGFVSQ